MPVHTLSLNGETLQVTTAGNPVNPAVFLFHSLGLSSELWALQIEALQASHYLIAMDCRGHGGSSNHGGFSVNACADDALVVLSEFGVMHAWVVGVSMGGLMTAELAARIARAGSGMRCNGMVLACSYRHAGGPQAQARIDGTAAMLKEKGMEEFARLYMEGTACEYMDAAVKDRLATNIAAMRPGDYMQTIASILTHDAGPALSQVTGVPALVISGKLDKRVPPEVLADLKASVPQAQAVELEKAGHLANIEDPAGFNRALLSFFR